MIVRWFMCIALLLLLVGCGQPPIEGDIGDTALGERAQGLLENELADIETAVEANDAAAARTALEEFQTAFEGIEADIQAAAPEVGESISTALNNLQTELNAETLDTDAVNEALGELRQALESLTAGE